MKTRRAEILAAATAVGAFGLMYRHVFAKLVSDWWYDDNYSHGFLIIPIALYLAWERRHKVSSLRVTPSWLGLAIVCGSIAVLLTGVLGSELFLTRVSMIGTLAGTILFLYGWQWLRGLAFPIMFLLLMIPLPAIIFNQIAFPLQLLASQAGEAVLRSADIPVLREGNVLILANAKLEVAEACSGIRSLVSLLTLGIMVGYFSDRRVSVRSIIAISTIPVAIVANGARVAGTGIAAHRFGPAAAEGFFHEFSGWVVFVVAFALMLAVQRVVTRLMPSRPPAQMAVVS
jgi:exosortase